MEYCKPIILINLHLLLYINESFRVSYHLAILRRVPLNTVERGNRDGDRGVSEAWGIHDRVMEFYLICIRLSFENIINSCKSPFIFQIVYVGCFGHITN
jgi:hypothetical protein